MCLQKYVIIKYEEFLRKSLQTILSGCFWTSRTVQLVACVLRTLETQLLNWQNAARKLKSGLAWIHLGTITPLEHLVLLKTLHTLCLETRWAPTNVVPIINYPQTKQLLVKHGVYVTGRQLVSS